MEEGYNIKISNDDVIEILKAEGEIISAYQTPDFSETLGVNDRVALSQAENVMKKRIPSLSPQAGRLTRPQGQPGTVTDWQRPLDTASNRRVYLFLQRPSLPVC